MKSSKFDLQNWLPGLALALIVAGQLYYLPERIEFWGQLLALAGAEDAIVAARLAYGPADYDLLAWTAQETSPGATILLVTASPQTYGDPAYVLYHRAIYRLYPRSIWWAAPVPPTRYPAWWSFSDLSEAGILGLARQRQATAILAEGFSEPPVPGPVLSFDQDTHLIFLDEPAQEVKGKVSSRRSAVNSQWTITSHWPHPFLRTLGALLSIGLWGDWLYGLVAGWLPDPSPARRLALAWLLGCGATSLATFSLLWAGLSLTPTVAGLTLLGSILWLYTRRELITNLPRIAGQKPGFYLTLPPHPHTSFSLFSLILSIQVGLVALAAYLSPVADWDAWVNWAGKANALLIDQTLSANLFYNPARLPTNMDYPLMLPLVEAWFYTWLGGIHEASVGLISLLFYGALLLLFYQAIRPLVSSGPALGFTALLATVPRLERAAHSGLADIPLAALVLLSFLLLGHLFDRRFPPKHPPTSVLPDFSLLLPRTLILAGVTGLLPWLKNEGWLWLGAVSLTLAIGLIIRVRQRQLSGRQTLLLLGGYLLVAWSIPLLWQLFLILNGTYRFTFWPLTPANFLMNLWRWPAIVAVMFGRLLNPYWNFTWLLAGLALVGRREKALRSPMGWLILPIIVDLALISLTYILSRFDPYLAHLNNSVERLILQATPLALWWLVGQSLALGWVAGQNGKSRSMN